MSKLWFLGEALIDFVPTTSPDGPAFAPRCGGSPFNAAKAAALAGGEAGFLGALSTDLFGDLLAEDLVAHGVGADHTPRVPQATTLAFVDLSQGSPRYAFFNNRTATSEMAPDPATLPVAKGDILAIGSISLIDAPGGGNIEACALALADSATLALDPNARPGMTADAEGWRRRIRALADRAGVLKLSDEDLKFLAPGTSARDVAEAQIARGTGLVVVTRGPDGAEAYCASGHVRCPGYPVQVVDTVGAGDTVTGYLLSGLAEAGLSSPAALAALREDDILPVLRRALAAAALNCTKSGCHPPERAEAEAFVTQEAG